MVAEQDRQANARAHADMEFLAREVASLRMAVGEVATRDFLRSELRALLDRPRGARGPTAARRSRTPPGAEATRPGHVGSGRMATTHRAGRPRDPGCARRPSTTPRSSARSPTSAWSSRSRRRRRRGHRHGAAHRGRLPAQGHHHPRRQRRRRQGRRRDRRRPHSRRDDRRAARRAAGEPPRWPGRSARSPSPRPAR